MRSIPVLLTVFFLSVPSAFAASVPKQPSAGAEDAGTTPEQSPRPPSTLFVGTVTASGALLGSLAGLGSGVAAIVALTNAGIGTKAIAAPILTVTLLAGVGAGSAMFFFSGNHWRTYATAGAASAGAVAGLVVGGALGAASGLGLYQLASHPGGGGFDDVAALLIGGALGGAIGTLAGTATAAGFTGYALAE